MKIYYILVMLSIVSLPVFVYSQQSQQKKIDSLINIIDSYPYRDTTKVDMLIRTALKIYYNDNNQSFNLSVRALELAEELGYKERIAESYRLLGINYYFSLNYQEAFDNFSRSLEYYDQCPGCVKGKAQTLANLGDVLVYFKPDSTQLAVNMYKEAITMYEKVNSMSGKFRALNNMALIYWKQGDYKRTIDILHEALDIQLLLDNKLQIAVCYNNLGVLHQSMEDYDSALKMYLEACDYFEKIPNNVQLLNCYGNIGEVLDAIGRSDEALTYYQKTLDLSGRIGQSSSTINAIIGIGTVFKKRKQYQHALISFQKALAISDSLIYQEGILHSSLLIGETYFELGKYNEAHRLANKALKMAVRLNDFEGQVGSYELLSKIYEKQNNHSLALNYFKKFKLLQDSLFKESNIKKITSLEKQYEHEKEKQVLRLEQERAEALFIAEATQQRIVRNAFIVGFLLTLILFLVILRYFLQKRKANKVLAAHKEEIESQAGKLKIAYEKLVELDQFKQGVTSMIVHDLKNPLNTILNVSEKNKEEEIRRSKQAAGQMLNMVLNILDVNKYKDSEITIKKTAFSILKIAQESIGQISFLAEQKNIFIKNNIDKTVGAEGEPEVVQRIFVNLLSNAVKHTPVNGKIELGSQVDKEKGQVILFVKDTGKGISKEYHEKVFEKFTQIEALSSGNVHSTGLGLTFCKMAVEAHRGRIWIDENYTGGACISFILPLCDVKEASLSEFKIETNLVRLTEQEKQALQKYLPNFKEIELYEISVFRKLFRKIENEITVNKKWLQKLKETVDYGNEKQFLIMINQIENE